MQIKGTLLETGAGRHGWRARRPPSTHRGSSARCSSRLCSGTCSRASRRPGADQIRGRGHRHAAALRAWRRAARSRRSTLGYSELTEPVQEDRDDAPGERRAARGRPRDPAVREHSPVSCSSVSRRKDSCFAAPAATSCIGIFGRVDQHDERGDVERGPHLQGRRRCARVGVPGTRTWLIVSPTQLDRSMRLQTRRGPAQYVRGRPVGRLSTAAATAGAETSSVLRCEDTYLGDAGYVVSTTVGAGHALVGSSGRARRVAPRRHERSRRRTATATGSRLNLIAIRRRSG